MASCCSSQHRLRRRRRRRLGALLDHGRGWLPGALVDAVASLSFLTHFESIRKGVIDLRDLVYFVSVMVAFLAANAVIVDLKKAD